MIDLSGILAVDDIPDISQENSRPLAMAFINKQISLDCFDIPTAFMKGTLFKALDKPFLAEGNIG